MGNRVYVLVEHYDRGSDEVAVQGVYSSLEKASAALEAEFPGYSLLPEDEESSEGTDVLGMWFYEDGDESMDRVMIVEQELK